MSKNFAIVFLLAVTMKIMSNKAKASISPFLNIYNIYDCNICCYTMHCKQIIFP